MSEELVTLYKLSKTGAILHYEVISRPIEDGAVLVTRKGKLGGVMQEDIEPMYPMYVGRANETTPWQQCKIMTDSKISKLKDKGYKVILSSWDMDTWQLKKYLEGLYGTDALNRFLPMLAQKDIKKITFPGYLQRKFDGVRNLNKQEAGIKINRSRKGKPFIHIDHISDDLPDLPLGWEYDGELYHHDRSLQQIVSMVKRDQPANVEIQYRVYDLIGTGLPYKARKRALARLLKKAGPSVHRVKTYRVHSWEEIDALFKQFREEGYEGAMWRSIDGLYECGERSWGLIKIKDFEEEEFEIIDVEEATGRDEGTAIFICITEDGKEFNCRPMGTREVRREYLDNFDEKYLGKMLTVRFQNYTDKGIPFHHRGVIIRDYE